VEHEPPRETEDDAHLRKKRCEPRA